MGMRRPGLIHVGESGPGRPAYPSVESSSTTAGHHREIALKKFAGAEAMLLAKL
jgi:hypothetical protein